VPAVVLALVAVVALASTGSATGGEVVGPASTDTSPVDLAAHVDMADGTARQSAIVRAGDARIEVLSPSLLRLEYSPTGRFENSPTVNAVDRRTPVPPYTKRIVNGWLTVRSRGVVFRYKVGSGPFTTRNTSVEFSDGGHPTTVHPTWEWECPFDQACQAGAASLDGGATISQTTPGYTSAAGYVGNLTRPGAGATWQVLNSSSGPATVAFRYGTFPVLVPVVRDFDVVVDGRVVATLTGNSNDPTTWSTLTTRVSLHSGTNTVGIRCGSGEGCDVNIDTMSVSPVGPPVPGVPDTGPLGGWIRGFDTATYNTVPSCTPGEPAATCKAGLEPLHTDGLLDTAGWRLLDDTQSAVWTRQGWVAPRPRGGDVEDGYLFAYGHDYEGALRTFDRLTGPPPLPDRNVFGVWYSDYTPYSSTAIETALYPQFTANGVPLNTLSLDTDWKSPNDWDGWEWNAALFPDATAFLGWAKAHGIDVTLNIHSSIADDDPELVTAERVAGGTLVAASCTSGPCKVWDWSSVSQAESNFSLQQIFQKQGVDFSWLDWCCDVSTVSMSGLTPDSWIDHLYAQELVDSGRRGFVLARIGSSNSNPEEVYPAGPWSDHTSTVAFTGDAWGTWNTLAREAVLTPGEATIGQPYVSDDIGSFLGPPPTQSGADTPALYDRWVQFGTFQPVLRLHSNNEDRLPWEYPQPVRGIAESFLRLRESLVPYTYTLAAEASRTALPMARPLYLAYPDQPAAYDIPAEYLYGPDMLVAPVTSPGSVATTTVWFPPGRWVDYFTGATFTGPSTATVSEPLDRMPVFVRAGGIVPEQPAATSSTSRPDRALTVRVYPGAAGSFTLYQDAGTGLGYTKGQFGQTPISTSSTSPGRRGTARAVRVVIGSTKGRYPDEATSVAYHVEMVDLSRPSDVTVDGASLAPRRSGAAGPGWSYDAATDTVAVDVGPRPVSRPLTIEADGTAPVTRAEPPPASS
jgi:alpha-glucosidase (family GH31 glycosyl hydrolase)